MSVLPMTLAMKYAAALLCLAGLPACNGQDSPVAKVVTLLEQLKDQVTADGVSEQKSYDKYACWCERELKEKAGDIKKAKGDIDSLLEDIKQLKAMLAAHAAEIKQLETDIAVNQASQKEAEEIRAKALAEYVEQKDEMENALKALESAITVLDGAGADKNVNRRNLRTLQQAQLLSTVGDLRGVLQQPIVSQTVSGADFDVIKRFVAHPQDFVAKHDSFSAVQIANNPFGDYAPQSTQIQGILKSLKDSFTVSLEKLIEEEEKQAKAHAELMATKKQEEATLILTLNKQKADKGRKTVDLATSKTTLDDTTEQLAADEKFFADTKVSCQDKALQWSMRTRLRAEELNGMGKALAVLRGGESLFKEATSASFLQFSATKRVQRGIISHSDREAAFVQLRKLASRYQNLNIAKIAVQVKSGGHFDAVLQAIDVMMETLREEEQEDIKHRDACQNKQAANEAEMEDLNHDIDTLEKQESRLNNKKGELGDQKTNLETDINETNTALQDALGIRESENAAFTKSLKDDLEAIALIESAIGHLSKFYSDNKLPIGMVQEKRQVPETTFQSGSYGGRNSETGGIIAILMMIKEDLEKEVKTSRGIEGEDSTEYWASRKDMEDTLAAQNTAKALTEKNLADTEDLLDQADEDKRGKNKELTIQKDVKATLETDCAWVESHFDIRRQKRKAEMQGLEEAKAFLMGATA